MRFLFDVGHPAHVHFFKHARARLMAEGHETLVCSRDKDVTGPLLDALGVPHRVVSARVSGPFGAHREYVRHFGALLAAVRRFKPDVITAVGGMFVAPVGTVAGVPSLVFTDTEHVRLDRVLTYPWASEICTPDVFKNEIGSRQRRYNGFQELAYLAPRYFRGDPSIGTALGLGSEERFVVVRFVSWEATHDKGHRGFSEDLKQELVRRLSSRARVLVTDEGAAGAAFPVGRVHDVVAHASLYIGEGATMATEAALLGTPSIYVSSLVGTMGNFERLSREGLVLSFRDAEQGIAAAEQLLDDEASKEEWRVRSRAFIERHVDVTDLIYERLLALAEARR